VRVWLTALRIARRETRRARGRSTLVAVMIMLPVLGLTFAAVSYDMFTLTAREEVDRRLGTADAAVSAAYSGPIAQLPDGENWGPADNRGAPLGEPETRQVMDNLPAGSRAIPYREANLEFRTSTGIGNIAARGLDARDPLAEGIVTVRKGRTPATVDEIALTRRAARRLGASIGDRVRLADGSRGFTVVGLVEFPSNLHEQVLFLPDALGRSEQDVWLVDTPGPVTWSQVKQLNGHGVLVVSRAVLLDPPPDADVPYHRYFPQDTNVRLLTTGVLVAGLAALEVILLAGPAFAVGARRRQRDLALVAANGGTPAHLRRIVLADGVVLGLAGAAAGIVLGVLAAFAGRPLVEQYLAMHRAGGYRVYPLALLAIVALAVVVGVLAALVPAFTAARQSVVAALTGRRGVVRSRKRWLVLGLVMTAAGAAIAGYGALRVSSTVILGGLVIGELGLVLCTPALVGLIARAGRLLPLAPRIALRDTARNRAAAAPAISAVMAAVAGTLAIGVYLDSQQAQSAGQNPPALPNGYAGIVLKGLGETTRAQLTRAAEQSLPVDRIADVRTVSCPAGPKDMVCEVHPSIPEQNRCPYLERPNLTPADQRAARRDRRCDYADEAYSGMFDRAVVDDGNALPLLTGATGDDLAKAVAMLRSGGVVIPDKGAQYVVDGKATVTVSQYREEVSTDSTKMAPPPKERTVSLPAYAMTSGEKTAGIFVSPGALATLGVTAEPAGLVAATSRMPTQAEEDRFRAAVRTIADGETTYLQHPHTTRSPRLIILAIGAAVVTLGAAGIATGLAAADGRRDLSTLAAVGASPRVRRLLSLSQSGVIAGLGSALGVVAGIGSAFAVLFALNQAYADEWPAPPAYPIRAPWTALLVVLVVPVIAMLGAGLVTRSRLPIERRLD
jgi:putative ABC transport system permease protein